MYVSYQPMIAECLSSNYFEQIESFANSAGKLPHQVRRPLKLSHGEVTTALCIYGTPSIQRHVKALKLLHGDVPSRATATMENVAHLATREAAVGHVSILLHISLIQLT